MNENKQNNNELDLSHLASDFFLKNTFIEASAGTGKTYTIQNLLLKIIESDGTDLIGAKPVLLSEILLVTFTEKAAGELRSRIRKILEDRSIEGRGVLPQNVLKRIEKALHSIDQAPIYTFHSFCDRVLSQYGFEAGVIEERQLVDKSYIKNLIERRCRDVWANDLDFRALILEHSFSQEGLISSFVELLSTYHPATLPLHLEEEDLDELKVLLTVSIATEIKALLDFIKERGVEKLTRAKVALDSEKPLSGYGEKSLESDLNKHDDPKVQSVLKQLALFNGASQSSYEEDIKKRICTQKLNAFFKKEVPAIYEEWGLYKKNNALKTFDDLIQSVYDNCIDESSPLVSVLRQNYRYAIIDEFQDTNFFQWGIFKSLFLNSKSNRLIVVGDPKQSIYSFQEANIQVYQTALQEIGKENGYRLPCNYRSSPPMIGAFNFLFSRIFEGTSLRFYPSKAGKTEAHKALCDGEALKPLFFGPEQSSVLEFAGWCAEQIQLAVNRVEIQCEKEEDGQKIVQKRVLSYGDIAILSRTRREMRFVEEALASAGIPFSRYKDNSLFTSKECYQLASLLRAIATEDNTEFSQKIKRAALLTPFAGKSLDEARLFDFENREDLFNQHLFLYQNLTRKQAWSALIESIFTHSQIEKKLLQEQKLQELAKYRQLADYVLECLTLKSWPLTRMASHLYNLHEGVESPVSQESALIAKDTDQNIVQVMTIHASKGLEFPVVFLAAGFTSLNSKNSFFAVANPNDPLKRLIFSSPEGRELYKQEAIEESRRLFYVAMTRAQYLLFLPQVKSQRSTPLSLYLQGAFDLYPEEQKIYSLPELSKPIPFSGQISNPFDLQASQKKLLERLKQIKSEIEKREGSLYCKATSYSKIAHGVERQTELGRENKAEEQVPSLGALPASFDDSDFPKGADFGNAIHEVLETIDFNVGMNIDTESLAPEVKNLIETQFLRNSLFAHNEDHIKKTAAMVKNTLLARLPKIWATGEDSFVLGEIPLENRRAEMQFNMGAWQQGSQVLFSHYEGKPTWFFNGFIDLIFQVDGRFCVLDWKSNFIQDYSNEGLDKSMVEENYTVQRALYSFVVVEWLASLKNQTSFAQKEKIYEESFGGVYYCYLRGTEANTPRGFHCSRYSDYKKLLEDVESEVATRMKNPNTFLENS